MENSKGKHSPTESWNNIWTIKVKRLHKIISIISCTLSRSLRQRGSKKIKTRTRLQMAVPPHQTDTRLQINPNNHPPPNPTSINQVKPSSLTPSPIPATSPLSQAPTARHWDIHSQEHLYVNNLGVPPADRQYDLSKI